MEHMKIGIRAAELSDVDDIALIETKAEHHKFSGEYADITQADNFRRDSFSSPISDGKEVFVLQTAP